MIQVSVVKPEPTSKLGISFVVEDGSVFVSKMQKDSLLRGSALKTGMRLLKINDHDTESASLETVVNLLKEADTSVDMWLDPVVGDNTRFWKSADKKRFIVASPPSEEKSVGLELEKISETGSYFVKDIKADSSFESTLLSKGMRVNSINGEFITGKDQDFVDTLLQNGQSPGSMILAVEAANDSTIEPGSMVARATRKSAEEEEIGLSLLKVPISESRSVSVVSAISDKSVFKSTGLRVGMTICKVNGVDVFKADVDELTKRLEKYVGNLSLQVSFAMLATMTPVLTQATSVKSLTSGSLPSEPETVEPEVTTLVELEAAEHDESIEHC